MKELILKKVLKNAYDFNGSVNPKVVLGQVLKENPELKKKVHTVLQQIEKTANEVRSMSKDEIKSQLEKIAPKLLVEKKEQKDEGPLKFLKNAIKGKLKVRIAPSPSGPMHIGHAYGVLINSTYARMYEGSLIVRIEDTNPENIYGPAYSLIEEDSNWITKNNVAQVVVQSSRLGMYYDYAEELVRLGKAYVCDCNNDIWREMKAKGQTCSCRILEIKEQQTRYAKMFSEYAEGEVILRLKTDIKHKNPAMRDFGIMRIVEHVHPKTGKEHRV